VHTLLPASEEAFEGAKEERTSTLQHALRERSAPNSRLATRVLAAHLFYQAVDLEPQPDLNVDQPRSRDDDEYWIRHQDIDNDLIALLARLPRSLRLPQNLGCQHAVFVNVLIHTATLCLHKTAIRQARDHEGTDAEFTRVQGRSRMLAAAAQILAVVHLAKDLAEALKNPILDYAAYLAALVFLEDFAVAGSVQSRSNVVFLLNTLQTIGQTHAVARMLAGQLGPELDQLGI
jgi:hypothetical protein